MTCFPQTKDSGVSVVLCCYNSQNILPKTLQYLFEQSVTSNIPWEIIVVDNASTDNTSEVALSEWKKSKKKVSFKVVSQPITGLSAARLKGIEESAYEYILFCDDDNWLDSNYIQTSFDIMNSNPLIGVLGGHGYVISDSPLPEWFEDNQASYAVGPQGASSGDISYEQGYVYGAAFIIRYDAWFCIIDYGFKNYLSDRKGKKLSSGGDVEICFAIRLAGYKIWYSDRLTFKHYLPHNRLEWKYFLNLTENQHKSMPIFKAYDYVFNQNGQMYKQPKKNYWIRESLVICKKLWASYKFILRSMYKDIEQELEGNYRIRRYRQQRGQLIGWLRLRSKYAKICNELYLIKNKTPG